MRIGVDGSKMPEARKRGPVGSLERGHQLGMDGLFFRTVLDMSPTLDSGELREIREKADELGMYVETGLGKVNPYANPEAPELRALGDGDILLGFRRMMEACAAIGCVELWSALANYKWMYHGKHAYDRFRTDVDWEDQLAASAKFMKKLAPIARDLGIHVNIETHEEVTSFELVRLVEDVGTDVAGIVYDLTNPLQRLEHPLWTAKRVAPYTRQTHCKDGMLGYGGGGVDYQHRPIGTGVVDYRAVLPILIEANPDLTLSIEPPQPVTDQERPASVLWIDAFDADFIAGHPDVTVAEYADFIKLVNESQARIDSGQMPDRVTYLQQPYDLDAATKLITDGAAHLRAVCDELLAPVTA